MEISIRPITSVDQENFLSLFDDDNFSHELSWKKCYCISYHTTYNAEEWHRLTDEDARNEAKEKIANGDMKGMLAFDGDECVGWLNVNSTLTYLRILNELDEKFKDGKTALAICYIIKKPYRGQHIASSLLEAALTHCKEEGYETMIAMIHKNNSHVHNFGCPMKMYLDRGFEEYQDTYGRVYAVKKMI